MIKVTVRLAESGSPIRHTAENTYTQQGLYCIVQAGRMIRYPLAMIREVIEEHPLHV